MKRLSDNEFGDRLDKGLCFRCNDKYSPEHRCKVKENWELMLFIMNEEEGGGIDTEHTEDPTRLNVIEVLENAKITLRSILGFSAKGTMKLKGTVKDKEVLVLIDSSATHNFIHQRIVNELELPISGKMKFGVVIGNGTELRGQGVCRSIEVKLTDLVVMADFLAIELGQMDVILGMQWLCTTGFMEVH